MNNGTSMMSTQFSYTIILITSMNVKHLAVIQVESINNIIRLLLNYVKSRTQIFHIFVVLICVPSYSIIKNKNKCIKDRTY